MEFSSHLLQTLSGSQLWASESERGCCGSKVAMPLMVLDMLG